MNNKVEQLKSVYLPKSLFHSLIEAHQKWEKVSDELEDFLLVSNPSFIKIMRKAREEDLKGKTRSLDELKKEIR